MIEQYPLYLATFACGVVLAGIFLWLMQRSLKTLTSDSQPGYSLLTGMLLRLVIVCSMLALILFLLGTTHLLGAMSGFTLTRIIALRNIACAEKKQNRA